MNHRSEQFLAQFDIGFREHIIEFGKRLTELSKQFDVVIFLARKAACLADCLDELGLSSFHCVITSNRVLDMSLAWMKGKRVVIVDDALISGTTISQALAKMNASGIKDVKVSVLSIDSYWWNPSLVNPIPPYFQLNSTQTSQLCANIVQAISVLPRPYTIDYPLFKNIRIVEDDFHELSNASNWIVYEATSTHQDRYDIVNLTIIPDEEYSARFLELVGLPAHPHFLVKIRLYGLKISGVYWCQILPIVILPPLSFEQVEKLFEKIIGTGQIEWAKEWFEGGSTADNITAKVRLIQYYLASQVGKIWHEEMVKKIDKNLLLHHDFKNLNFLFPPPISDVIRDICVKDHRSFSDLNIEFSIPEADPTVESEQDFDELKALQQLSSPFLGLYKEKELAARELVKEKGEAVFSNEAYKGIIDRLNQGFSIRDLRNFIAAIPEYINKRKLISYFLDLFIDKGVVVPITCVRDGMVYRAFRHGEDVEFSENEMRLCMALLHKFANEYGVSLLPHTVIEKLLVLFVRIGIQKNFLTVSTAPLSDFQSIGVRYYLHGAVVGSFDKQIYKVNMQNSLTSLLEGAGYISRKDIHDDYRLHSAPVSGVEVRGLNDANLLGTLLGNLLKVNNPKISLDELILIATVPSLKDAVGALAAEVYIFQGFYKFQSGKFFTSYGKNKISTFGQIRRNSAWTAINSGTWKFENFKNQEAWKIIEKCAKRLDGTIYGDVWKTFWPTMGKETSQGTTNSALSSLLERLADFLFTTRFYLNLMEISLLQSKNAYRGHAALVEMKKMLETTKRHHPQVHDHLYKLHERATTKFLTDELNKEELYNYCVKKLEENFQHARQLLAEVDTVASNFGKIDRVVYFEHCIVIDFKQFNKPIGDIRDIYKSVLSQIRAEAKRIDNIHFFEIPHQYSAIKTGTWLCTSGKNARRWLLQLSNKLIDALDHTAQVKVTSFFNLGFFRICKRSSSNEYEAPLFWDIAKELLKRKHKVSGGHELVYFTANAGAMTSIENEIKNELATFKKNGSNGKPITIAKPYSLTFQSSHFIRRQKNQVKNIMDIGIITIVTTELLGVTDVFKENNCFEERKGTLTSRTYRFGKLNDKNGRELNVVACQAIEQGNRSIIGAYNALTNEFSPDIVVLLGIGGSINKDVGVCDVAIANAIFYYDKRAETENGIERRGEGFKIGSWTIDLLQNFQFAERNEEPVFPAAENSPKATFKAVIGPIGSGESVVKYREAEIRRWLLEVNSKTLALETEAGGFGQQFYEDELNYSKRPKGIIILRGISDKADIEKDDKYRLAASKNAMTVLQRIISANEI